MPAKPDFTILYGSQTGQSKAIAEEIHERSANCGLTASIFCLSLVDKKVGVMKSAILHSNNEAHSFPYIFNYDLKPFDLRWIAVKSKKVCRI